MKLATGAVIDAGGGRAPGLPRICASCFPSLLEVVVHGGGMYPHRSVRARVPAQAGGWQQAGARTLPAGSIAVRAETGAHSCLQQVACPCCSRGLVLNLGCLATPGTLPWGWHLAKGGEGRETQQLLLLCLQCQRTVSTYFSKGDFHQEKKKKKAGLQVCKHLVLQTVIIKAWLGLTAFL